MRPERIIDMTHRQAHVRTLEGPRFRVMFEEVEAPDEWPALTVWTWHVESEDRRVMRRQSISPGYRTIADASYAAMDALGLHDNEMQDGTLVDVANILAHALRMDEDTVRDQLPEGLKLEVLRS